MGREARPEIAGGLRKRESVEFAGPLVEHVGRREGEPCLFGWLCCAAIGDDDTDGDQRKPMAFEEPDLRIPRPGKHFWALGLEGGRSTRKRTRPRKD